MPSLKNTIEYIIQNRWDFCCLCFDCASTDLIRTEDEVFVALNGLEINLKLSEVLFTILDNQTFEFVKNFNSLCSSCAQKALKSYVFIKNSQINSQLLTSAITGLLNGVITTVKDSYECRALFVSLNLEDFTSQQFYDNKKPINNASAALKRFDSLLKSKLLKPKIEMNLFRPSQKKKQRKFKKRSNCVLPMSTAEMLHDKNDSVIKCKECFKVYNTMLNLRNHFVRIHAPKVFQCSECPKKFGSPAFLEAHKTENHCEYVCSECGKIYHNRNTFKMHEMGHFMRLVCQDCGRVYKNKSTFKKHIEWNVCHQERRASPANAKFTCDYCNKKYTQKVSLRVHIQYEHGNYKAHVCKHCNKKFWAQSRLKAHMVKHTKERKFKCEICDGKFVTKESLLYHTRIHTGEKPYECPECDAKFLSASRRSEHVKRYHTNATLECEICGSKFSSYNYLHKHKKGHMKIEKDSKLEVTKSDFAPKVVEPAIQKLAQDLKKSKDQHAKTEYRPGDEIYLEFTDEDGFQFLQYSKPNV